MPIITAFTTDRSAEAVKNPCVSDDTLSYSSFVLEIVKVRGKIEFFAQALVFVFWMLGLIFLITAASCDDPGMLAASGIMLSIMPVILVIALINDCLSNRRYEVALTE